MKSLNTWAKCSVICYVASNEIFLAFFSPFFVLSNQCGLSCLKKSVLPLKNFSFIIKSTAPSNIKCLKNVLTSQSGFLIVFSTLLKKKIVFFFLICIFQRQKQHYGLH